MRNIFAALVVLVGFTMFFANNCEAADAKRQAALKKAVTKFEVKLHGLEKEFRDSTPPMTAETSRDAALKSLEVDSAILNVELQIEFAKMYLEYVANGLKTIGEIDDPLLTLGRNAEKNILDVVGESLPPIEKKLRDLKKALNDR